MTEGKRALVVRGGWDGHMPVETTNVFIPFLEEHGLVDMIVHRKKVRDEISRLLSYFAVTP